jgi:hypothetical protein
MATQNRGLIGRRLNHNSSKPYIAARSSATATGHDGNRMPTHVPITANETMPTLGAHRAEFVMTEW